MVTNFHLGVAAWELAEAARGRIRRLVFISSARAQAGLSAAQTITEADTPHPIDAYGRRETDAVARMGVASRERVLARSVNARILALLCEWLE